MDEYYSEDIDDKPKNRITYCLRCRLTELYDYEYKEYEHIRELMDSHRELFADYLYKKIESLAPKVKKALKKAGFRLDLRIPTYLVHKYNGDSFAQDMIDGFTSGRYDGDSSFCEIEKYGRVYDDHCDTGCHMIGINIEEESLRDFNTWGEARDYFTSQEEVMTNGIMLYYSKSFAKHALLLLDDIDLEKYGEGLMECALTHRGSKPDRLRRELSRRGVKYPFDTICQVAAVNYKVFREALANYRLTQEFKTDVKNRNKDIALDYKHIHPDHKRAGLNFVDILILLNPRDDICVSELISSLDSEDLQLLMRSLKYWLENVKNEKEYELIRNHIKCLEKNGCIVNL